MNAQPLYAGGPFGMIGARVACIALPVAAVAGWVLLVAYSGIMVAVVGMGLEVIIWAAVFSVPLIIFSLVASWLVYSVGLNRGVGLTLTPDGMLEWRAALRTRRIHASTIERIDAPSGLRAEVRIHHATGVLRCSSMLPGLQPLLHTLQSQRTQPAVDLAAAQPFFCHGAASRQASRAPERRWAGSSGGARAVRAPDLQHAAARVGLGPRARSGVGWTTAAVVVGALTPVTSGLGRSRNRFYSCHELLCG